MVDTSISPDHVLSTHPLYVMAWHNKACLGRGHSVKMVLLQGIARVTSSD
jgi:hypothetical protein